MSLVLNTNLSSMVAQNSLTASGSQLATSLQQLSSGMRINTAADDAAGYAIVQGMTSQINGINQAARNANDGVSLAQTASGALQEVVNDLQTMRDLAVQSLNATNSTSDRADLDAQFQQLKADIDNVASQTQFNGVNLLDGTFQGATFQVGANAGQSITMSSIASSKSSALGNYYNGLTSVVGQVKLASGTSITTATGTAGTYNATTLAGSTGLNTAVNGSTVTLGVQVDGTSYTTSAINLTGTAATDLKSIAAAINQSLSSAGGLVASVNSAGTGIQISGTADNGAGHVVNFSVSSATDAGGNSITGSTATLASLGVDSSDIVGTYTPTTGGSAASAATTVTTGGTYNGTNVHTAFDGTTNTLSGTNTASVTFTVTVNGGTAQNVSATLDGTEADDLGALATAINGALSGTGVTASVDSANHKVVLNGNASTMTGSQDVVIASTGGTDADGTALGSAPSLTDLGVDAEDNVVYTAAVAGTPGTAATSSSVQYASGLDVKSVDSSNKVLISIDQALQQLATSGAQLGAYQNRFQASVTGLSTDVTNLTSARSQIQDTDYASATSALSKAQILQQASTAMVAQANTIPQNILTLLQKLP